MPVENREEREIRRYLLGMVDEETEKQVDLRLMSGGRNLDRVFEVVETQIIDDVAAGRMSSTEMRALGKHSFWSPRRIELLRFARAFGDWSTVQAQPQVKERSTTTSEPLWSRLSWLWNWQPLPAWSLALASMLLLVVVGGSWMLQSHLDSRGQLATQPSDVTIWLSPGLVRGDGEVERLILPSGTDLVSIQLDIGIDDYDSYRATLHDAQTEEIWSQSKLPAASIGDRVAVTVTIPAKILQEGDYHVRLSGRMGTDRHELIGRYHFRVVEG